MCRPKNPPSFADCCPAGSVTGMRLTRGSRGNYKCTTPGLLCSDLDDIDNGNGDRSWLARILQTSSYPASRHIHWSGTLIEELDRRFGKKTTSESFKLHHDNNAYLVVCFGRLFTDAEHDDCHAFRLRSRDDRQNDYFDVRACGLLCVRLGQHQCTCDTSGASAIW